MSYCDSCLNKDIKCDICTMNPDYRLFRNYHKTYEPVCPLGYTDCVCDPGYIYYHYPDWYKELHGNKTIQEAALTCQSRNEDDPIDYCSGYDDEDK